MSQTINFLLERFFVVFKALHGFLQLSDFPLELVLVEDPVCLFFLDGEEKSGSLGLGFLCLLFTVIESLLELLPLLLDLALILCYASISLTLDFFELEG